MFKLGIIGSDNSHAEAYGALANTGEGEGNRIPDVAVTHIYGTDPVRTKEVADKCKIPNIVDESEDMLGEVDGVVCVWRHGSKHLRDTAPFIKAGLPAFVDKPLACSVADARELITTAQDAKVGFTSFSSMRVAPNVVQFFNGPLKELGELKGGFSTGPADMNDQYDGLYFYGIHAVEMMVATFGYGVKSVCASTSGPVVHAICNYGENKPLVTINFVKPNPYVFHVMAFGQEKYQEIVADHNGAYFEAMKIFVDVMRTGKWFLTAEQLLEPIQVMAATIKSVNENRTVLLSEV
jgi:predicted dehydrogenase